MSAVDQDGLVVRELVAAYGRAVRPPPATQYSTTPLLQSSPSFSSRSIVHLDADAFFASVEQAADARLRGQPVAVGGEKRGIIASASYEARRYGVYTPMPTVRARRLCPRLIVLPGDYEKYERFSRWMFSYAYDFTPGVEIGSIDEGYFDLTAARRPPLEIAETIRHAIRQALKITVSEGIGTSKLVSQIASKLRKPAAFVFVPPGGETAFLHPLANHWLPGIGPQTATRLNAAGLALIGQLAATPVEWLSLLVGRQAAQLREFANGRDDRPVVTDRPAARSYGQQETFAQDTTDEEFLNATLRRMADALMVRVRADGKLIRTVTVKVRYNDMAEDQRSESLGEPTDLETDLYPRLRPMLRQAWRRRVSLRLVSLKLGNVYAGWRQMELLAVEQQHEASVRRGSPDPAEGWTAGLPHGDGRPAVGGGARSGDRRTTTSCNPVSAEQQHEARRRLAAVLDELHRSRRKVVVFRGHEWLLKRGAEEGSPDGGSGILPDYRGTGFQPVHPGDTSGPTPDARDRRDACPTKARTGPAAVAPVFPLHVHSCYSFLDSTLTPRAIVARAVRDGWPAVALTDTGNLHGAVEFSLAAREAGIKPILGAEVAAGGRSWLLFVENAAGYRNLCRILSEGSGGRCQVSGVRCQDDNGWGDTTGLIIELAAAHPAVHYGAAADRWQYDVVQSIRTLTLLRQEHPAKRRGGDYHFPSPAEMRAAWSPALIARAREIAARCAFAFELGKLQFPAFRPPDGSSPREFLRRLVFEGLRRRYRSEISSRVCETPRGEGGNLKSQIAEELGIIHEVGYEEYFLVVWDLLQECRRRGIEWITRGSAADSLVCYCLGISDVCPVRFDLYFRRFLNKDRMALQKLPDIDLDFAHDRKDDVVELVLAKYGPAHAAVVGGFSTYQGRSALADVAKVLGVSEYQVRRFTERVPRVAARDLAAALAASQECRDLPVTEEPYQAAVRVAALLDGFPRYPKMHPCGVVLSRAPLRELVPCFRSAKGWPTTQFDMDAVEAIGLVKIDILAQGGLAVMRDVGAMLERDPSTAPLAAVGRGFAANNGGVSRTRLPDSALPRTEGLPGDLGDLRSADRRGQETGAEPEGQETGAELERIAEPERTGAEQRSPHGPRQGVDEQGRLELRRLEPWDDPAVWAMIAAGGARAVHHIESPAMISLSRMCHVREIDGLIAIVSVIRPGAANEHKKQRFTRRYQGREPVEYPHPSLTDCLRSTYGMVVYEEHILQIGELFAGMAPGRADLLRRALNKERWDAVETLGREFAAAARARGRTDAEIARVWELVRSFSGYAFCKAHSTAYGVEAYQSAWLKRYYPAEFMAAVLTNGKGFYRPLVYVLECHRLGIPLLPPWVNEPGPAFQVVRALGRPAPSRGEARTAAVRSRPGHGPGRPGPTQRSETPIPEGLSGEGGGLGRVPAAIRVPVTRAKGLTARTTARLLAERDRGVFAGLADFFCRVRPGREELEVLQRVGAFDGFGAPRTAQFWEIQRLVAQAADAEPALWSRGPGPTVRALPPELVEPTRQERLQWENELLDFPASGHPLELYPDIAWETYCPVAELGRHAGATVVSCGLIVEDRLHHQADGEPMKFLTLADWTGLVETELFAPTYKSHGLATVRYPVLEVTATVEPYENGNGYSLRIHRAGPPRRRRPG